MDEDYDVGSGAAEEELSLPKATVTKLIQEMMPADISCAKDARDLIADCCVEFIHMISSEANEICEKEAKKTIAGEHVLAALQSLGFEEYVQDCKDVYEDHLRQTKDREKRSNKLDKAILNSEEAAAAQEALFAKARQRMQSQDNIVTGQGGDSPSG
ncbi:histone-fold-containing protein [Phlyctochytrium arcticum]|nr:histone-fold-containing protein [Phlyctochytrium arcticum]